MACNVFRNGLHIGYCKKKDFLPGWGESESEFDKWEINEVD